MRGFIIQPTYRIVAGRPVVHLWGKLETGQSFLVRDGTMKPHFYVSAADEARARELGAAPLAETDRLSFAGEPVLRVEAALPGDTPPLRDKLRENGVACFEADVRFAMRFLIDRGIRGSLNIEGESRPGRPDDGADLVFDEPKLEPVDWTPRVGEQLTVLSFDIETDPKARRLLSIALHGCGASEVMLFCPADYERPASAIPFDSEKALFAAFCERVRELDPDVLLGWNVIGFDLVTLERIGERVGLKLRLGRDGAVVRLREVRGRRVSMDANVPGRVVLDGIQLLRGASIKMESYALDAVARQTLGEGKVDITAAAAGGGDDHAGNIVRLFKEERARLVEYNLVDARLALEIIEKYDLLALIVERSRLTGMPIDRVFSTIAAFDFVYLSQLAKRRVVAPTVGDTWGAGAASAIVGGHVMEPRPGLYRNVVVFDFKSLYPSLMRTFQIDPLGYVGTWGDCDDPITAPNGAAFRREPAILPALLDEFFPRREAAKQAGDGVASFAIKILMNSFYGVLGAPSCRFFNPAVANAITSFGKELLLWTAEWMESRGQEVLYGDTDSVFVRVGKPGSDSVDDVRALGVRLARELNDDLARHIAETWRVESRLELELEGLYLRLFLPPMRHGGLGARKRYVGLMAKRGGGTEVAFKGMEVVRSDWTALAKQVQRELYERLFSDRPVEQYLSDVVADLRGGRFDDGLVYRKGLRKDPSEYTSTTPPHVVAARKLGGSPPRIIAYYMTKNGPEPASLLQSPIDYEHYVEKQIAPVAEPVLTLLDLEFRKVVGDEKQMSLF